MKNISKQYQDLLEGKMSRDNFVRNCRQQFPQFISPVTSIEDAIKILKNKRIVSENIHNTAQMGGILSNWKSKSSDKSIPTEAEIRMALRNMFDDGKIDNMALVAADKALDNYDIEDNSNLVGPTTAKDLAKDLVLIATGEHVKDEEDYDQDDEDTYNDLRADDRRMPESLNEAENKTEGRWKEATGQGRYDTFKDIDNVNFTTFLRAVAFEVSKDPVIDDTKLPAIMEKIAKAMKKDPMAYRDLVISNTEEIKKQDEILKMREVKPGTMVDKDNGMKEIKGQEKLKAMSAPKSENKKGKPEGVKEMGVKPKTAPGIKQTMDLPGKEKVLETLINTLKKSLTEDTHHKYTKGTEVKTPDGTGIVTGILGGTVTVKLKDNIEKDFQINTLDHFEKKAKEEAIAETNIALGVDEPMGIRPGVDMGAALGKMQGSMHDQAEFENLMKRYDWYAEMSDDSAKLDTQKSMEMQIMRLAKSIGSDKAVEIWNRYAPDDRKVTKTFFMEGSKKDKYSKLKEFLKKAIKEKKVVFVPKGANDQQKLSAMQKAGINTNPGSSAEVIEK